MLSYHGLTMIPQSVATWKPLQIPFHQHWAEAEQADLLPLVPAWAKMFNLVFKQCYWYARAILDRAKSIGLSTVPYMAMGSHCTRAVWLQHRWYGLSGGLGACNFVWQCVLLITNPKEWLLADIIESLTRIYAAQIQPYISIPAALMVRSQEP